jgi:predicted transposase YbfD/YdcC
MDEDILIERQEAVDSLLTEINLLDDVRINRTKKFTLGEIFFLVLCAQICGYETFREYETYGRLKINLLRKFLPYKNGHPSRSTIARVLALFEPKIMEQLFIKWMQKVLKQEDAKVSDNEQDVLAVDGKTHRGLQGETLHLVSAFDTRSGLVLGEEKVNDKSNEITAIPELLDALEITGQLVSIDAMGCQTKIAAKIRSKNADYLLALKGNQGTLLQNVADYFESKDCLKECKMVVRTDKGHGRIETRTCYTTDKIDWLENKADWEDLRGIVMIEAKRLIKGKETTENRFYITSAAPEPAKMLGATRAHWGIENSLHWVLDVIFGEDDRIIWNKNIAQNESIIRRIALNLLKKYRFVIPRKSERSERIAIKTLRKVVVVDDDSMEQLLRVGI